MSLILEGIRAHVLDYIGPNVHSSFVQNYPELYFFAVPKLDGENPYKSNTIGSAARRQRQMIAVHRGEMSRDDVSPRFTTVFGSGRMTADQAQMVIGKPFHHFKYKKNETLNNKTLTNGGATSVGSANAARNFGTAFTKFCHKDKGCYISKDDLDAAALNGDTAVGSLVDDVMQSEWEDFKKDFVAEMWTDDVSDASQLDTGEPLADANYGILAWLTANNVMAGIDRSVETFLNPLNINAATQFGNGGLFDLSFGNKINYGFTDALGATHAGLQQIDPRGKGVGLCLTTATIFQEVMRQAERKGSKEWKGIEDHWAGGCKFPVVEWDNVLYVPCARVPAGYMAYFNLDTWVLEFQEGYDFTLVGPVDESETIRGGNKVIWWRYEAKPRQTCRMPWLNALVTGVTVP